MTALTDEQLMVQLQKGNAGALDELYHRHARNLHAFCRNLASTSHDPEDLVQDAFLRVIKSAHTFDPQRASFRTWLYRIARNRCIDVARRASLIRFLPITRRGEGDERRQDAVSEDVLIDKRQDVEALTTKADTAGQLDTIFGALAPTSLHLTLPKFHYDADFALRDALTDLGMVDAFGDQADFSGIDGSHELFVEQVYHQAFVNVDEAGTEAAAASAVAMARKGALQAEREVRVERPFLFLIGDIDTNAVLFLGHVVNPLGLVQD